MEDNMRKMISTALAGVMLATTVVASTTPALADPNRDRFIERYYIQRGHDDDYWVWRKNRHRWRDAEYRRWYDRHDHDFDDDELAAGVFGLAAGALFGAAIAGAGQPQAPVVVNNQEWLAYCTNRFQSFDPATGTYLGYDGERHPCVMP
jgi:hypothetical protein